MLNQLIRKKPRAVIFDLCGVILNSRAVDIEAINYVLVKHDLPTWDNGTKQKKDNKKSMKDNFPNFFGNELANSAYDEYLQYLIRNIERMTLFNGAINFLEYCKKNSFKIIMISNRDKKFIEIFLNTFKVSSFFDFVLTPDDTGITKPDPKMLDPVCNSLNLNLRDDTILFVGDSFADVNCAFLSGCIPILFQNIIRNEINDNSLKILRSINIDNPIREIKEYDEFIEFLEKSKKIWENQQKVTKITYIGANGKIGRQALSMICDSIPTDENIEIVLMGSGTDDSLSRLKGVVLDEIGSLNSNQQNSKKIKFTISNDYKATLNSSIVLCSAAKHATEAEIEKYGLSDPSGRIKSSFVNKKLIETISCQIEKYSPHCLLVIVTNQVDMMCNISRKAAPSLNVIGVTGGVDSARLKQLILEHYDVVIDSGFIVGYHNSKMIPLISSIKIGDKTMFPILSNELKFENEKIQNEYRSYETKKLEIIVDKCRTLGKEISVLQKKGLKERKDTGASILPAKVLLNVTLAYCFGIKYEESFNTLITDQEVADHFGVSVNTPLSIPLEISKNQITQSLKFPVLDNEKIKLREAQEELCELMKLLESAYTI